MRVKINENNNSLRDVGFDNIYVPGEPCPDELNPGKSPYVIFQQPYMTKSDVDYVAAHTPLHNLGTWVHRGKNLVLVVTGNSNVIKAVDYFANMPEYKNDANRELMASLQQLRANCVTAKGEKPPQVRPSSSRSIEEFEDENLPRLESSHPTSQWRSKSNPEEKHVFKENVTGRKLSEIEAFNARCFDLLLGKRHPEVRSVFKENGERAGVMSKMLSGFMSIEDYTSQYGVLSSPMLIASEMIKVWVACYVEEEADTYGSNVGFDKLNRAVKIDDDRATWPLTSKYVRVHPDFGLGEGSNFPTEPVTDFFVTTRDIASFPLLIDAKPNRWPDRGIDTVNFDPQALADMANNIKCINDKYYMFLKRAVIPSSVYAAIGTATIGSESTREKYVQHKYRKTGEIAARLSEEKGFQDYLAANPDVIDMLIAEFNEYNDSLSGEDQLMRVDVNRVRNKFQELRQFVSSAQRYSAITVAEPEIEDFIEEESDENESSVQPIFMIDIDQPAYNEAISHCTDVLASEFTRLKFHSTNRSIDASTVLANNSFNIFIHTVLLFAVKTLLDDNGDLKAEVQLALGERSINELVKKELIKSSITQALIHLNVQHRFDAIIPDIISRVSNSYVDAIPSISKKFITALNRDFARLIPENDSANEIEKFNYAVSHPVWHKLSADLEDTSAPALGMYSGSAIGAAGGAVTGGLIAGGIIGGLVSGPLAPLGIVVGACIGALIGISVGLLLGVSVGTMFSLLKMAGKNIINHPSKPTSQDNQPGLNIKIDVVIPKSSSNMILVAANAASSAVPLQKSALRKQQKNKQKEKVQDVAANQSTDAFFAIAHNQSSSSGSNTRRKTKVNFDFTPILQLLREKKEFFIELVLHSSSILSWSVIHEANYPKFLDKCAELAQGELNSQPIRDKFMEALVADSDGDSHKLSELIFDNPGLEKALKPFLNNPAIDEWYKERRPNLSKRAV